MTDTALRWVKRHTVHTVRDQVARALAAGKWSVEGEVPGGQPVVTMLERVPTSGDTVKPNVVAVTFGPEVEPERVELGSGLKRRMWPVFVDVFGTRTSVAMSIGEDVNDWLWDLEVPLLDAATGEPVPGARVEFVDPVGPDEPDAAQGATDFRRYWQVVKTTAVLTYGGGQ